MKVQTLAFEDLDARMAYDVWRLRQQVFVVEQECPYPDLDGRDTEPGTRHLVACDGGDVVGYLRVLDDGDVHRIGRVVVLDATRRRGLGRALMEAALTTTADRAVVLDAQSHLADWYGSFGFTASGPEFLEDGIPHVPMARGPVGDAH